MKNYINNKTFFLLPALTFVVGVMLTYFTAVGDLKSESRVNAVEIQNIKEKQAVERRELVERLDKIEKKLDEIWKELR